jgi:hypothetical protein
MDLDYRKKTAMIQGLESENKSRCDVIFSNSDQAKTSLSN